MYFRDLQAWFRCLLDCIPSGVGGALRSWQPPGTAVLLSLPLWMACGEVSATNRIDHVLVITVDTLRADRLSAYGYEKPTSPRLDQLAAEGTLFSKAYATSSWTLPSTVSLLTSTYPSTHGCLTDLTKLGESFETLAECLSAAGFRTGAATSNFYLARRFGLDQGFDEFDEELAYADRQECRETISSTKITDKGIAWLDRLATAKSRRGFLWLHYFDPHSDYMVHEDFADFGDSTDPSVRYDSEVSWTDHHIGRLLDHLDHLGLRDETLVVVMADHGEEFGEHGGTGHRKTLYEEVVRVPMIVRAPGFASRRVDTPVSIVDLAPTIFELLDVPPIAEMQGQSLVAAIAGEDFSRPPVLVELGRVGKPRAITAVIDGKWKAIHAYRDSTTELFDLDLDPGEEVDLSGERADLVKVFEAEREKEVGALLEQGRQFPDRGRVELSTEDWKVLEALGYTGHHDEEH